MGADPPLVYIDIFTRLRHGMAFDGGGPGLRPSGKWNWKEKEANFDCTMCVYVQHDGVDIYFVACFRSDFP